MKQRRWLDRFVAPAALLALLPSANLRGIDSSLQPEEIEDAYSLGQTTNHEELADFLKQYEHDFDYPPGHPAAYVTSVEFQTPYEQIVLRSRQSIGYTKFKASEDYLANPTLIIVRVIVGLVINYAGPVPPADDYSVVVSQSARLTPRKISNTVTCDPISSVPNPSVYTNCLTYTRELDLDFDLSQFTSGRATVKVLLPFGQSQQTSFNLNKLR